MKRLRDLEIHEVSLVDRPAVRDPSDPERPARFLLWKSEDGGVERMAVDEKVLEALEQSAGDLEVKLEAELSKAQVQKDAQEAARMALRLLNKYKDRFKDVIAALAEVAGYGYPEPKAKTDDLQINKADLPPHVREALEKTEREREELRKRLEETERIAKAEREARLNREYVEKAARDYRHLAKAEELGPILRAIDEKLERAEAEKLHEWLRAADERIARGDLFKEFGKSGGAVGSPFHKLGSVADELRKADPRLSEPEALEKAAERHPELYAEYVEEIRKR